MFSVGDTVRVCYDGKGSRARKGEVLKTVPRHGKKKRVKVSFYEWGAENPRLVTQWFKYRKPSIERDKPYLDEFYQGKLSGRRKIGKLHIKWKPEKRIEYRWSCERGGGWMAYVQNEASIGGALFGWCGDFYSLHTISHLHEWPKEFQDKFWGYNPLDPLSEGEHIVVKLRDKLYGAKNDN